MVVPELLNLQLVADFEKTQLKSVNAMKGQASEPGVFVL